MYGPKDRSFPSSTLDNSIQCNRDHNSSRVKVCFQKRFAGFKQVAQLNICHTAETLNTHSSPRLTMIKVRIFSCISMGRLYLGFSSFTSLSLQKSFFTTKDWNLGPQFSTHISSSCTHKNPLITQSIGGKTPQLDNFFFYCCLMCFK